MINELYIEPYQREPKDDGYYKISLNRSNRKHSYLSLFTRWIGEQDGNEIRQIDYIDTRKVQEDFQNLFGQNISTIENLSELKVFIEVGGHSIINHQLVENHWKELNSPAISIKQEAFHGYIEYDSLLPRHQSKNVNSSYRKEIIERDIKCCQLCKKHQFENDDVQLEIHHIQPWNEGGLTYPENLITLCRKCHLQIKSIDRNYLFKKVGITMPIYGNHFIEILNNNNNNNSGRKAAYYNANSVTIKLPEINK